MSSIESSKYINVLTILGCEFFGQMARYGISSSLTLFLRSDFGYSTDKASTCYILWAASPALFAILGGYTADMYWGKKKTILVGGIIYACSFSVISTLTYIFDFASRDLSSIASEVICWIAMYSIMVGGAFIRSSIGLLGAAQLEGIANLVNDDEDLSETADADQKESTPNSNGQHLIESYWNWFYFAMYAAALVSYTGISYLCQVHC